jgi:hypothetical protein
MDLEHCPHCVHADADAYAGVITLPSHLLLCFINTVMNSDCDRCSTGVISIVALSSKALQKF